MDVMEVEGFKIKQEIDESIEEQAATDHQDHKLQGVDSVVKQEEVDTFILLKHNEQQDGLSSNDISLEAKFRVSSDVSSNASYNDERLVCDMCEFSTLWSSDMYLHRKYRHRGAVENLYGPCSSSASERDHNIKSEESSRHCCERYNCDHCDYSTKYLHCMKKHTYSLHKHNKQYNCDVCDFSCSRMPQLIKHRRTHTDCKPHKCAHCSFTTKRSSILSRHIFTKHTGTNAYKCDECDYSTPYEYRLVLHKRVHTGEKPFKCDICNYASARLNMLNAHYKRKHTADTLLQHRCDVCNYKFSV